MPKGVTYLRQSVMVGMAESVTVFHTERVLRLVNQGPAFDSTVLPGP